VIEKEEEEEEEEDVGDKEVERINCLP